MVLDVVIAIELVGVNCVHRDFKVVNRVVVILLGVPLDVVRLVDLVFIQGERVLHGYVLDVARLNQVLLTQSSSVSIVRVSDELSEQRHLLNLADLDIKDVLNLVVGLLFVTLALAELVASFGLVKVVFAVVVLVLFFISLGEGHDV